MLSSIVPPGHVNGDSLRALWPGDGGRVRSGERTGFILERGQPFSRSWLWKLQRNFFQRQGVEAWRQATVPHYITNNPFIARAYAALVAAWLRDWRAGEASLPGRSPSLTLDPRQPVYLIELGAGCGRFAFLFLQQLRKIRRGSCLPEVPFRYVMTDFAERNLAFWSQHARLRPWVDEGLLDFALYDADGDPTLRLRNSGETLTPGSVLNPVILVANYFFDGIPQDLFTVRKGKLHALLLTLSTDTDEPDPDDPDLLNRLQLSCEEQEVSTAYYPWSGWNRILEDYRRRLPSTTFSFPSTALRCLRGFQELAGGRLLLLTADRGSCHEASFLDREEPKLAMHGSFSMEVNYHALGQYCRDQGGQAFQPASPATRLPVSAFVFGRLPNGPAETARAYAEVVDQFGPDAFFTLKKGIENLYDALNLDQLLAYLRFSDWDPNILVGCSSALMNCLATASAAQKQEVFRAVHRVWDHYYPIGEATDLAFHLGILLHTLDYYPEAIPFYEHARTENGPKALTAYNLGACHHRLHQLEPALRYIEEALEIDPDFEQAKKLRLVLQAELAANAG